MASPARAGLELAPKPSARTDLDRQKPRKAPGREVQRRKLASPDLQVESPCTSAGARYDPHDATTHPETVFEETRADAAQAQGAGAGAGRGAAAAGARAQAPAAGQAAGQASEATGTPPRQEEASAGQAASQVA